MNTELGVADLETWLASQYRQVEEAFGQHKPPWCGLHVTAGLLCSQLRRYGEARENFSRAAWCVFEELAQPTTRTRPYEQVASGIHHALLGADFDAAERFARHDVPEDKWADPIRRAWTEVLRQLVLGDGDCARAAANRFAAIPDHRVRRLHGLYSGLAAAAVALLDSNSTEFNAALESILCQHGVFSRGRGRLAGSHWAFLCVPAVQLAVLARRTGLALEVHQKWHAVPLKRHVAALQEWNGRHVYREPYEVIADFLPYELVSWPRHQR